MLIGKRRLRILVQILHVRMRGSAIEVEVMLLHVLAVVALVSGQAKEPFLEEGIALVPQRHSKADELPAITDAGNAIFIPAVGPRPGVIVRKVVPGIAVGAVVLAHRAPCPLAQIWSPALPMPLTITDLGEPDLLFRHKRRASYRRARAC